MSEESQQTKHVYISSISHDSDTLEIIEDKKLRNVGKNSEEHLLRYLKKDSKGGAEIIFVKYLVTNKIVNLDI